MAVTEQESGYVDLNLYEDAEPVIDNPLHLFLQEVELALKIAPGSIWGCKDSISLSRYVFNQYVTINQIRQEISSFIQQHCKHSSMFNWIIDVEVIKVDGHDLIYIALEVETLNQRTGEMDKYLQKFVLG